MYCYFVKLKCRCEMSYSMFLERKMRVFTWYGDKWLRKGSTITPPLLKTRSDGTLVPGIERYFLAMVAR